MPHDGVEFEVEKVVQETDKALLIEIDGEERWIPKAVIHDDSEVYDGDQNSSGTLILKSWWAEKEGLL